jgi:hypothetical protein
MPSKTVVETNPLYHVEGRQRRMDVRTKEEKKADIVIAVTGFYDVNDYSPSEREVMEVCQLLSLSTTRQLITELLAEGRLSRTNAPTRFLRPIVGRRGE